MVRKITCQNGYYRWTTEEYYTRALAAMPYAQAGTIVYPDGRIALKSYSTIVLVLFPDGTLICTGLYSMTTRKHIGAWLKENVPGVSYQTVRAMVEDKRDYNVNTGEFIVAENV